MNKNYDELINQAIEELKNNDDLFTQCVDELDGWNGYADGFRCFPMWELDDLFHDVKLTDFLDKLGDHFDHNEDYFCDTIYGITSTDDKVGVYRDNVDEGELLDNLIDRYNDLDFWFDPDFSDLIEQIIEARDADEEEEEDTQEEAKIA